jgi:hypothetical protein
MDQRLGPLKPAKQKPALLSFHFRQRGKKSKSKSKSKSRVHTNLQEVKHNTRLTWRQHIDNIKSRAMKRLACMRKLSGTFCPNILRQVYVGSVRPVVEYASASWATSVKTNQTKLARIQNMGLRMTLGTLKSTPIAAMERQLT